MTEQEKFDKWVFSPNSAGYPLRNPHDALLAWMECAEQKQAEIDALRKELHETKMMLENEANARAKVKTMLKLTSSQAEEELRKELEQAKELHKDALILLEQEEVRHEETKAELEQVKMHNAILNDEVGECAQMLNEIRNNKE